MSKNQNYERLQFTNNLLQIICERVAGTMNDVPPNASSFGRINEKINCHCQSVSSCIEECASLGVILQKKTA